MNFRIKRGLFVSTFTAVTLLIIGSLILVMSVKGLYMLFPFALIMLLSAVARGGIEFDVSSETYRDYTDFLGIKTGKWKSYSGFKFVSYHSVILSSTLNLPKVPVNAGVSRTPCYKIFLLDETHTKKILVCYADNDKEKNAVVADIIKNLGVAVVRYNPPISETTLKRRRKRGL